MRSMNTMSVTVLILNWRRPENLKNRILPNLLADPCVSQILIAHGDPATVFGVGRPLLEGEHVVDGKITHIGDYAANGVYRSFRRWLLVRTLADSGVLTNGYLHVQDDDLVFQRGHLEAMREAFEAGRGTLICGTVGRILKTNTYDPTSVIGPCDLVVGQSIFSTVRILADAVRGMDGIPFGVLREDDLVMSCLANVAGKKTSHYALRYPCHLLPSPDALSDQPGHREARGRAVRFMLSRETERPYVSVGAVFKQEAHALREWIEHYRWLGVDRIYLIDDGSTDDYLEQMEPYMDMIVCLRHTVASERFGRQGKIYDACLRGIPSEWLLIVDPDEFLYSPLGQDLKTWLRSYASYNQILIPWHVFGSDGLIEQPASLVQGFRRRASKGDTLRINPTPYKAVVRMPSVVCFSVHAHSCRGTTFELPFSSDWVLNHYMIQSLRYYLDVKCTRGSANRFELCPSRVAVAEQAKTWDRFRFIDALATLEDNGLAQLRFPMPNSVA